VDSICDRNPTVRTNFNVNASYNGSNILNDQCEANMPPNTPFPQNRYKIFMTTFFHSVAKNIVHCLFYSFIYSNLLKIESQEWSKTQLGFNYNTTVKEK
jgi:hypothetical protein